MSEPFLAEMKIISWNYPPKGWAFCNGQLLPINQNQALFSLLGTTYGGDGRTTFGLPDLRGRTAVHLGSGYVQGQKGGEEVHTLTQSEMPAHNHVVVAQNTADAQNTNVPTGNFPATDPMNPYRTTTNTTLSVQYSITSAGGSQPHENRQPYLVVNVVMALIGIFPSRN